MAAAWVPDDDQRARCPEASLEEWQVAYSSQFEIWEEEARVFRENYGAPGGNSARLLEERRELRRQRIGEANMASLDDYAVARRQKDLTFFIRMWFLPGIFRVVERGRGE